jgi:signal transduction histidine kinase
VKKFLFLLLFVCITVAGYTQQVQIDSLLNALGSAESTQQSSIQLRLAQLYASSNSKKAIDYANQAYNNALNDQQKIQIGLFLGGLYSRTGNGQKAIDTYGNILYLATQTNDADARAKAQVALGSAYFLTGNLSESLNNYLQSLRYYEGINDATSTVGIYNGLANIYEKQGNYSKALEYNLKAIDIYESSSNKFRALVGYEQIGNMYLKQNNYAKASEYLQRALLLYTDLKNVAGETSTRVQLGHVSYEAGNYDEAEKHYQKALSLAMGLNMIPLQAASYNGLALVHEKKSEWDKAIAAAKKAVNISQRSNLKIELERAYETLSRLYKNTPEKNKAVTFDNLSREIKDSLYNDSILKQLADLQLRFDGEKQQQQIEIQQKEQEVLALQLSRERQYKNTVIIALISVILALAVFMYLFNQNKKIAQSLYKQKEELQQNNEAILKQKEELGQLNNVKDRFFSIISHDLRNNLTTMKLYFDLIGNPDYVPDEDNNELSKQISASVENTIDLLENLLVWAQTQIKGIEPQPQQINMNEVVRDNINLLGGTALHKGIALVNEVEENIHAFADVDMINLVVRNLISNAIKFTNTGGRVQVKSNTEQNRVIIQIADNGVGISKASLERMFVKNENPTTLGTGNEKGTGLGLLLCKEFVEKNNGKIYVESVEGLGSTFFIELPKA